MPIRKANVMQPRNELEGFCFAACCDTVSMNGQQTNKSRTNVMNKCMKANGNKPDKVRLADTVSALVPPQVCCYLL